MSWYGLITFCAVYFVAVATPGPGVAAVIAQGLARGSVGAPAFIAGFVVGDLAWFLAAALGLSALAQSAHTAFVVVKYAGAAYLLFLALKLWLLPAQPLAEIDERSLDHRPSKLFAASLTLTLGNPKPMIFFVALLPTVVPLENLRLAGYLEIGATIAVILPAVLGAYVLAASRARVWFRSPRSNRLLNRGSGTLMAAAAVAVAAR
ncbi:MAG: LysE family translocator [Steroidobacteraceae bacterium]|jgi:threonine/homoserine/homoserine lactone efflux protein